MLLGDVEEAIDLKFGREHDCSGAFCMNTTSWEAKELGSYFHPSHISSWLEVAHGTFSPTSAWLVFSFWLLLEEKRLDGIFHNA